MLHKKGFTLVEILLVIGVLAMIVGLGITVDFSSFNSTTLNGEEAKIISLLEKARSRSMSNMFDTTHGFCYDGATDNYVIFKGSTCTTTGSDLIPASTLISENSSTTFPATIIFSQLTGNSTTSTIHITDGTKSKDITINNAGTINW